MYVSSSRACDEPNSTSPMTPERIAAERSKTAWVERAFVDGNETWNSFLTSLGGNSIDAVTGDSGIPTTGQWSAFPLSLESLSDPNALRLRVPIVATPSGSGDGSRAAGGTGGGPAGDPNASCRNPVGSPLTRAFYPAPTPMVVTPIAARAPAPARPVATPAAPGVRECVWKELPASGMLPARRWQECTVNGLYSCGWNEYMESINWDRPFPSAAAAQAAADKYSRCVNRTTPAPAYGSPGSGMSGVLTDGPGASVLWGSIALGIFSLWAAGQFGKKGHR